LGLSITVVTKYRMIDLFAGAGGLTRGFLRTSRFYPVAAVEMDLASAATYAANFGRDHLAAEDIGAWLRRGDIPTAHVVVGGPPCQGFSQLGKRRPDDPRNYLWRQYVEVLKLATPMYFVVENVPQFLDSAQYASLEAATRGNGGLRDYELAASVVDASEYGVPQRRRRGVVIGRHRDMPILPPMKKSDVRLTVGQALQDVAARVDEVDLPTSFYDFEDRTFPGAFKTSQLHLTRRPTKISQARYEAIPPGGNRFDLPDHLSTQGWRRHRTGSADVMGRLHPDKPSVTIRTEFYKPEKGRYLHPVEHRALTHYEAALLQSFDDDQVWCGSKTSIGRQIGNAVPPRLAQAIAENILEVLS
jgi:DNA (cytosine-5)-methyltransferase 1